MRFRHVNWGPSSRSEILQEKKKHISPPALLSTAADDDDDYFLLVFWNELETVIKANKTAIIVSISISAASKM